MGIHAPVVAVVGNTVQPVEQLGAGEGLPWMLGQSCQQVKLAAGEANRLSGASETMAVQVNLQVASADEPRRADTALHAAQHCPHAGHQFAGRERFGDVVVRAQLQPDQPVGLLDAGGEHNDWHVRLAP